MKIRLVDFLRGFSRTPLRGGILMLAVTICLILAFGGTFAIAIFGPEVAQSVLKPWVVILLFGILAPAVWARIAAALPPQFSLPQILFVFCIGVLPVLLGTLYQYYLLATVGPEGCHGGNIAGLFLGTLAVIGAAGSMVVGSIFRR